MVFYFSGTGNSYHVAKKLAEGLGEKMIDMARATREDAYEYTLKKGEKLGFVFPVHAWAPPQMVEQFVQRLELYYEEDVYTYAVCTCGQSAGETMSILEASLEANDLSLDSGYSVIMPDNYAVLFKAPSPETQRRNRTAYPAGSETGTERLLPCEKRQRRHIPQQCGKPSVPSFCHQNKTLLSHCGLHRLRHLRLCLSFRLHQNDSRRSRLGRRPLLHVHVLFAALSQTSHPVWQRHRKQRTLSAPRVPQKGVIP